MRIFRTLTVIFLGLFIGFWVIKPASAQPERDVLLLSDGVLCGNGSAADNYGFAYAFQQPHWSVDWENYVSEDTVNQVDATLDMLNYDNIAQTMILFKPQNQVGNRVNCAVHFLRYMKLGQLEGERKDNGFVFLIVVEDGVIEVHYGVGMGLPALTAQGLTPLNRLAEDTYKSTGSMDQALLALVKGFDEYARSKYTPWHPATPTPVYVSLPFETSGPTGSIILCCLACLVFLIILLILYLIIRFGGRGGFPGGRGYRPMNIPTFRFPSIPRGFPGRGGSGSGRSGRGN
jgi:hypothetical protein